MYKNILIYIGGDHWLLLPYHRRGIILQNAYTQPIQQQNIVSFPSVFKCMVRCYVTCGIIITLNQSLDHTYNTYTMQRFFFPQYKVHLQDCV